jgi:maleamate amidohydrolase
MAQLASRSTGIGDAPALIVVDATLGFTDTSSPLGADYPDQMAVINRITEHARKLKWPIVFSKVAYYSDDQASVFREKLPSLNLLTPDSEFVALDPGLTVCESDMVLEKQFASCFFETSLHQSLQLAHVDSVLVAGFTTSGCVRATAVDALQYNYRVTVIEDAVGDRDPEAHEANLKDLRTKYADVVSSGNLLD